MTDITELEQMVSEQVDEVIDNSSLRNSEIAYNAAVVLIDLITGYTVGVITIWYYGVIWFLGNAVVFFLHHKNWERSENNEKQEKNAMVGMIVSVCAMLIVAVVSGGLLLTGIRNQWVEVGIESITVTLFFFHALQLAVFRFSDDTWKINRAIAKAKATANKKVEIAKAAGQVVAANKKALQERNGQYQKHGDRGAVDAAMAKMEKREYKPAPMLAMSADTEKVELAPKDK